MIIALSSELVFENSGLTILSLGWTIKLSSETDWLLYLGSPGYSFPTFSPTLQMRQVTLKKSTSSYISFKPIKYVQLARRGYFDTIDHCKKNINLTDTIRCNKKCYVERLKVCRLKNCIRSHILVLRHYNRSSTLINIKMLVSKINISRSEKHHRSG